MLREKPAPELPRRVQAARRLAGLLRAIRPRTPGSSPSRIERVERRGVRTADGRLHELDVLVLATGFQVDRFLRPIDVVGRDGLRLDDVWAERPSPTCSVSIPGFPNLFMLNGPNGPVGNFSLIEVAELQLGYIDAAGRLAPAGRAPRDQRVGGGRRAPRGRSDRGGDDDDLGHGLPQLVPRRPRRPGGLAVDLRPLREGDGAPELADFDLRSAEHDLAPFWLLASRIFERGRLSPTLGPFHSGCTPPAGGVPGDHITTVRSGATSRTSRVGDIYKHWPGKTITEYDDHLFCMITMNHHPVHTNVVRRARVTPWQEPGGGQPRLLAGARHERSRRVGAAIANLEVETLKHAKPTFHGDTIYAETRVLDKQLTSKGDRGIVTVETKGINQHGDEVCYFQRKLMVWTNDERPARGRPYGDDIWDATRAS